jgi:hypothetical protein
MFLITLAFIGFYTGFFKVPDFTHAWVNLFILLIGAFVIIAVFFYAYKRLSS